MTFLQRVEQRTDSQMTTRLSRGFTRRYLKQQTESIEKIDLSFKITGSFCIVDSLQEKCVMYWFCAFVKKDLNEFYVPQGRKETSVHMKWW